jgi:FtsZ-interacting cell division protein ZipA
MDAATFRFVLVVIAVLIALAIYLYGLHQSKLRRRSAIDSFTRDEIDSAFGEDEALRDELDNLNQILREDELDEKIDEIEINPGRDAQTTPFSLPDPEIFLHPSIADRDADRVVSYHLRHEDFRLITGEEADDAVRQAGLETNVEGLLECREDGMVAFRIASLSAPGDFSAVENLDFSTLGFNCFIDLDDCEDPRRAYETLLKKVDELVRLLNVKVYKPDQQLLTISDVTTVREKLA